MSTVGATHDECMECQVLIPIHDHEAHRQHYLLTNHFGWMDIIVDPQQWKRSIESVEGTCQV